MKVPAEIIKSVGFVGSRREGALPMRWGTAFFITRPVGGVPGAEVVFAVTAKHVFENIRASGEALPSAHGCSLVIRRQEDAHVALVGLQP